MYFMSSFWPSVLGFVVSWKLWAIRKIAFRLQGQAVHKTFAPFIGLLDLTDWASNSAWLGKIIVQYTIARNDLQVPTMFCYHSRRKVWLFAWVCWHSPLHDWRQSRMYVRRRLLSEHGLQRIPSVGAFIKANLEKLFLQVATWLVCEVTLVVVLALVGGWVFQKAKSMDGGCSYQGHLPYLDFPYHHSGDIMSCDSGVGAIGWRNLLNFRAMWAPCPAHGFPQLTSIPFRLP